MELAGKAGESSLKLVAGETSTKNKNKQKTKGNKWEVTDYSFAGILSLEKFKAPFKIYVPF